MLKIYYDRFRETCHNIFKSLFFSPEVYFLSQTVTLPSYFALSSPLRWPLRSPLHFVAWGSVGMLHQKMTSSWRTGLASLSASISATTTPPSRCRPTTTTGATSVASCRLRFSQCTVWTASQKSERTRSWGSCKSSLTTRATPSPKWNSNPGKFGDRIKLGRNYWRLHNKILIILHNFLIFLLLFV